MEKKKEKKNTFCNTLVEIEMTAKSHPHHTEKIT